MQQLLAGIVFVFIFSSCSDHSKNDLIVFNETNKTLQKSNQVISQGTTALYRSLDDKLSNPASMEKAMVWQPKVVSIKQLTSNIINYLEILKDDLKKEAGVFDDQLVKTDGQNVVTRFFKMKNREKELYKKLVQYRVNMLGVDAEIKNVFEKAIPMNTGCLNSSENENRDFATSVFNNIPVVAALALLNKFETEVKITENQFVQFCHERSTYHGGCGFGQRLSPIVSVSTSYVKAGGEVVIYAGLGSFSALPQPIININGRNIPTDENAIANYKFKAPSVPGKHNVTVKFKYTNQDGSKSESEINVEYTVALNP